MPTYKADLNFPYSTTQLFNLVIDIEKYPEFLPWCSGARITSRSEENLYADLIISFKIFTEKYTSKVTFKRPIPEDLQGVIRVDLKEGPFTHLHNYWEFIPQVDGCKVIFDLDFTFKSKILESLIGSMFNKAAETMVDAFNKRAKQIYGNTSIY